MLLAAICPLLHLTLLAPPILGGAPAAPLASPSVTTPSVVAAPHTNPGPTTTQPTEDPQARVGALINQGQALFDTADYVGAIDRWTEAYAQLPDAPHLAAARNLLAYQIAQAQIQAFAMDLQPVHLRKAERLLKQYLAALDSDEIEARADAERRLAAVEVQIQAPTPTDATLDPSRPLKVPAPVVSASPPYHPARGPLLLVGGISLGLGGALLVSTALSATSSANFEDARKLALARDASKAELERLAGHVTRADHATLATAIVGGVLIATGVALVVKGHVRPRTLTAQPMLAPGLLGARLGLRF